ncbi:unnamed protein product [Diatraea saccharalis]|uniref:MADF domain-containing protein n=1 Tax=Diatraea saccharalis TaxID=40085 RepID=A0A9N9QUV5_9NEOP|nr:unnamed protein product [Diatraea saccharalis]
MSDRFTETQMLKLVEIYRDYECLWDVTSAFYKNRDMRESAYKQIAERLNIPGVSPKDIPKKIKNLRSSYYQELKKIEKSIRSGADQDSVYKPRVSWFTTADELLKTFRIKHETFSNNTLTENEQHEMDEEMDEYVSFGPPLQYTTPPPKPKHTFKRKSENQVKSLNLLQDAVSTAILSKQKKDEYSIFGEAVANELREINSKTHLLILKKDIMNLIFKTKIEILDTENAVNCNNME